MMAGDAFVLAMQWDVMQKCMKPPAAPTYRERLLVKTYMKQDPEQSDAARF
jgi:hypothetical protein